MNQERKAVRASRGTWRGRSSAGYFDDVFRSGRSRARVDEKRYAARGRRRHGRAIVRAEIDAYAAERAADMAELIAEERALAAEMADLYGDDYPSDNYGDFDEYDDYRREDGPADACDMFADIDLDDDFDPYEYYGHAYA